ncbi:hypothetical protein [Paenibacillus oleatilyticus]|uniref:hypothetical protein n=1 Tax=Paenibacillus oleatilyticus TaxID=2594886 RepID=UPI001C20141C|nr:hypothetical protein [Paenibacillus oleatilyticus]MBU7316018.1 hypothetical protein [Paenibacillus oleatilyticus]
MPKSYTQRGFAVFDDFESAYCGNICVVESSLATDHCVWIQFDEYGSNEKQEALHLNKEEAKRIIAALKEFVEYE